MTGTGSHVFLNGIPLTSMKKGSRAQGSHVVWETADQLKKRDRGLQGKENR